MRAIAQQVYGSAAMLTAVEVGRPSVGAGEVLVRVRASSVNARDWHVMRGDPKIARWMDRSVFGRQGPANPVPGGDFAGTVEAVGDGVADLAVGEEVFGEAVSGAFAEYIAVPRALLDRKPANLSFEEAAAVPLAANTALTCLRHVGEGERVLIIGASGGVGTFAVQIARARGAQVTGVCSTRNVEAARALGAEHVVDYTRDTVTGRYDTVLDLAGTRNLRALLRLVEPTGTLVLSGGGNFDGGSWFGPVGLLARGQLARPFVKPAIRVPTAEQTSESLTELRELIESGLLRPAIDRTYPLAETAAAIEYMETEHARAKIVITVASAD
ncbi:NAD(P)-dependent alcohol dehydrogenase [Nocardia salmonicida]|uniref:NAD(P)-dependent alcohol dehydrogenase n=1 Tax=Nocardia salmonicida TaxID=53431 RepID=UPI0007A4580D|nr:NAD(P)-dependent alcohol dehydrogenase [Nocardia salmonicida]